MAVMRALFDAELAGASSNRFQDEPSYQNAAGTESLGAIQKISMLFGMRDTAVMPPLFDAEPVGASSNRFHGEPSYQNASCTEPLGAIQKTSMLLGMRETAAILLVGAALPGRANWNCCQDGP